MDITKSADDILASIQRFCQRTLSVDAYDNAMCESFFATLECELLDRRKFQTKAAARMAIFQFIEGWYNPGRRHSALGYQSPVHTRSWIETSESGH